MSGTACLPVRDQRFSCVGLNRCFRCLSMRRAWPLRGLPAKLSSSCAQPLRTAVDTGRPSRSAIEHLLVCVPGGPASVTAGAGATQGVSGRQARGQPRSSEPSDSALSDSALDSVATDAMFPPFFDNTGWATGDWKSVQIRHGRAAVIGYEPPMSHCSALRGGREGGGFGWMPGVRTLHPSHVRSTT